MPWFGIINKVNSNWRNLHNDEEQIPPSFCCYLQNIFNNGTNDTEC